MPAFAGTCTGATLNSDRKSTFHGIRSFSITRARQAKMRHQQGFGSHRFFLGQGPKPGKTAGTRICAETSRHTAWALVPNSPPQAGFRLKKQDVLPSFCRETSICCSHHIAKGKTKYFFRQNLCTGDDFLSKKWEFCAQMPENCAYLAENCEPGKEFV